jgi:hypothetical protein
MRSQDIEFPFTCREMAEPVSQAKALFARSFRGAPPSGGRHFVSWFQADGEEQRVAGYIHFYPWSPGVFLCGGLCVDSTIYRQLSKEQREIVRRAGSLARWLVDTSISMLGPKRAVFGYTGNAHSRRDGFVLGCVPAGKYLIVQWHEESEAGRQALIDRVSEIGPF